MVGLYTNVNKTLGRICVLNERGNMVIECVFKEKENGEIIVDKEATEKRLKEAFPNTSEDDKKLLEEEEKRMRKLLEKLLEI